MNNMDKARAALAALPRCTAKSRQTGGSARTRALVLVANAVSMEEHQLAVHPLMDD